MHIKNQYFTNSQGIKDMFGESERTVIKSCFLNAENEIRDKRAADRTTSTTINKWSPDNRIKELETRLTEIYETIHEINMQNYTDIDVDDLNEASVNASKLTKETLDMICEWQSGKVI